MTACAIVLGLFLTGIPLFTGEPVGGMVFNLIMLGYGLSAVLAIALALTTRGTRPETYRICAAVIAFVLALLLWSIERYVPSKPVALILLRVTPFLVRIIPSRLQPNPESVVQGILYGSVCMA